MWILKISNLILLVIATGMLLVWTFFETALQQVGSHPSAFFHFFLVWGGSLFLIALKGIKPERSISGRFRLTYRFNHEPFNLVLVAFCCGFTLHALSATSLQFDVDHLDMPYFLPALYLPLHFGLVGWLLFLKRKSAAERGLALMLIFHAMNGAIFNTEFYLITGLACITLLETILENREKWSLPPMMVGIPLMLLLCLVVFSTTQAINPIEATQALCHVGVCAAMLAIIVSRPRSVDYHLKLIRITLFASTLVLITVAWMLILVGGLLGPTPILHTRLSIFYQHPNFLAPYFAMIAMLGMALFLAGRDRWEKSALLLFVPCVVMALWLCDSRAGYLGFLAGLSLFTWLHFTRLRYWVLKPLHWVKLPSKRWMLGGGALVLVIFVVLAGTFSGKILSAIRDNTRLQRAQDYRIDAWSNSLEIIRDHPVHGVGLNTFLSVKKFPPGSKFSHESKAPHPHNLFLYVAQSCGLPALVVFLLLLGGGLYAALTVYRRADDRRWKILIIACLSASAVLLICGLMDLGLALVTLFPGPLWLFLGIIAALYNQLPIARERQVTLTRWKALVLALALLAAAAYGSFMPTMGRIFLKKAYIAQNTVSTQEGIRLAEKALEYDPYLSRARDFLLLRYLRANSHEQAMTMIQGAILLEPNNPNLHMDLGLVLAIQNDPEGAVAKYLDAIRVDHGSDRLPEYYARLINKAAVFQTRDEVTGYLEAAIRRDIKVINLIDWKTMPHPSGRDDQYLEVGGLRELLRLEDVLNDMFDRRVSAARANITQDRFDWFSLYLAFFNAHIDNRALAVLDEIEKIFGERELQSVQAHRATIARRQGEGDQSALFSSQVEELGDANSEDSELHFKSQMLELLIEEGKLDEAIARQRATLAQLRDFKNFASSFEIASDNLIRACDLKQDPRGKADALRIRLFFFKTAAEKIPAMIDLAECCRAMGRLAAAEKTIVKILEFQSATWKLIYQFEDLANRGAVQRAAYLLAKIHEDMGLSPQESLFRAWGATDLYSTNASRILFRIHFLMRCGLPERALQALNMALLNDRENLMLLELKAECLHMVDDMLNLHHLYQVVTAAHLQMGVKLEERVNGLFKLASEDQDNILAMLELGKVLSYQYKLDHAVNLCTEASKLHPEESRFPLLAARILRMDSKPEAALAALQKAMALDPDNFKAAIALRNLEIHLGKNQGAARGRTP